MKPFRLVLIGAAVIVAVLLVAVAVAFNSSFQTWAARKALAKNSAINASVGSVDAGLKRVELKDIRVDRDGALLTLPLLEAELPVIPAGVSQKVSVTKLVAKGWVLDLSKTATGPAAPVNPAVAAPAAVAAAAQQAFAGVFGGLQLPVDLSLDGVQLEGEVILPAARGRAKIVVTGGGLGAGREGKFELTGDAALKDEAVNRLTLHGNIGMAMDTPRSFTKLMTRIDAAASGAQFPKGVNLTADLAAAKSAAAETYSAAVVVADRTLLMLQADFPANAQKLTGTWKLDVRDTDVAPFALGQPLPAFTAMGEGKFDTDAAFTAVHASGKLEATADRLATIRPELAGVGAVKLAAEFDVAHRGDAIAVDKLDAAISGAQPVATVRALQAFTLDAKTRQLQAADPAGELLAITLQGVPLAWAQPFLKGFAVSGGDLRGELVATTRSGGLSLRAKTPLTVAKVSVTQPGRPLLMNIDFTLPIAADYAPQGWQAETTGLTAKSGDATLFTLEAKAGQLAGPDQPVKATGKLAANLPAVLAQPAAGVTLPLIRGDAGAEFVASFNSKTEVQAKIIVQNLTADPKVTRETLPTVTADVRADIAPGGQIALNAPIDIERDGRKSDLTVAGTVQRGKDKLTLDAQVTSSNLVMDDARILAALAPAAPAPGSPDPAKHPAAPAPAPGTAAPASNRPPWAGIDGTLKLALKKLVYTDTFQMTDVAGTVRIDAGTVKFEKLGALTNEGGEAKIDGALTFNAKAPQPYALKADVMVRDFDPGPFFKVLNPQQPPTVEGKFTTTSQVVGSAKTLPDLPLSVSGDFNLSSRGGTYRGLPVNVSNAAENTGRVAAWIASASTALGAITGKKEYADIGSKAQALAELTAILRAINYDQLSVVATRDPSLNASLKDFTLISPEIRLSGNGTLTHRPDTEVLDDALAMEYKLRARGRVAELLKYLGALDPQVDDLGYAACTIPFRVKGTPAHPDTSETNQALAALLVEKGGVTEKAGELFNRLIGGSK